MFNGFDISTIIYCRLGNIPITEIYYESTKVWPSNTHDYSRDYLTFTALENGTFKFTMNNLQYSLDNGSTWTTLTAGSSTPTVNAGNKILWKQTGLTPDSSNGIGTFSATGNFNASGNIMSLYYGDNFFREDDLTGKDYAFRNLFRSCTKLQNAENLVLPATTLTRSCYSYLFHSCSNLTTAPELPAMTMKPQCYQHMFNSCTSLTTAPELPATTLANGCYMGMFQNCSSLTTAPAILPATTVAYECYLSMFRGTAITTAPELPAKTLAGSCYGAMFRDCTNLNYIECLATDISANNCTGNWVNNVAPTGTFIKDASMNSWTIGNNGIPTGWVKDPHDYSQDYLTFTALENGTFKFTMNNLQYSLDNGSTWTTLTAGSSTPTVNAGNKILWKQTGLTPSTASPTYGIGKFSSTGKFAVSGNIMSLYYGDNFVGQTSLSGKTVAFYQLFYNCSKLLNAHNLVLPATILAKSCYTSMFEGCTSLTTTPALPSTTLSDYCYEDMFYGCTSLTIAPELPATTLYSHCYQHMFTGCTSLTTAPALPATSLATACYFSMFQRCTSLTTAPALQVTTLENECYSYMFAGCTSLTTAPALPATILTEYCYRGMFQGCTSLTTAPALPATSLHISCYENMFADCTSLTAAPSLPATIVRVSSYMRMFYGCTSLTAAPSLPATSLYDDCYWEMFYGCTSLISAPITLPATTLSDGCYYGMFYGCTSLTTAPELPATTLNENCYRGMFAGCTSLTTAPDLPAATLAGSCYYGMFYGCTSLSYIKCLATNIRASNCTTNWVRRVAATGTFVKASSMSSWTTGYNGKPIGWTVIDAA